MSIDTETEANNQNLSDRDLRQRDLVPPQKLAACHAVVIGVGAVGRQVAIQLAATGICAMTLIDHDVVNVVNLAPQGYAPDQLGQTKVAATAKDCRRLNPALSVEARAERFRRSAVPYLHAFIDEPSRRRAVLFCCVDSIVTRSMVWEAVRHSVAFFADARMNAEVIRVLATAHPSSDEYYSTTLFTSEEAFAGSCTARSTIYTASIAAGLMLTQFTRWLRDLNVERDCVLNLLAGEMTSSVS